MTFSSLPLLIVFCFCLFVPIYSNYLPPDLKTSLECPMDMCFQPLIKGRGLKYLTRYYYDRGMESCRKFIYNGSRGNKNNFIYLNTCEKMCKGVCTMDPDPSNDKENYHHYYYDAEIGKCDKFNYGGSGGNGNNFKTLEECKKVCIHSRQM